ncbi:MAG TPA: hypothetical protein VIY90_06350 [Steroidobacteraceae bacterium]
MARPLNENLAELPAGRRKKINARAAELVAEEMSLRDLRHALGKTQAKVAADLGVGRESVARYTRRTDILVSTLSEFVHKAGGTLELTVRFPHRNPVKIKGFGEISSRSDSLVKTTRASKSLDSRHRDRAHAQVGAIRPRTVRKEYGAGAAADNRSDTTLSSIPGVTESKPGKRKKSTAK